MYVVVVLINKMGNIIIILELKSDKTHFHNYTNYYSKDRI